MKTLALTVALLLSFGMVKGEEAPSQEVIKMQAIFIVNFTKYIQWPEEERAETTIGIYGESEVATALIQLVSVKSSLNLKVKQVGSFAEAADCDLLFVPRSSYDDLEQVAAALQQESVLIVTETEAPIEEDKGGIGFYMENKKMKFVINRAQVEGHNLKVSNNLLGLARVI